MKKLHSILAIALAIVLCLGMTVTAFATSYTVEEGDSLWSIAKEQLGSGTYWTKIYEANKDTIKNPDLIYAGQVLEIPDNAENAGRPAPDSVTPASGNGTTTPTENATASETFARTTQYGMVKGTAKDKSIVWYGIPYAAAPVGELRWTAPISPAPWSETLDCTIPAEEFIQYTVDMTTYQNVLRGTEDCLKLDVYATEGGEDLPVLVYIHGGNNQTGSSGEIEGSKIVVRENCVYVSINYRLGLLGFNCLPALQTTDDSTGNYAMLDIAKALDWVKANIAAFGGNPDNITVAGFSAGGRDVMAMLISPMFEGKFDKAIVYSGGMTVADETASADKIAAAIAPLAVADGKATDETTAKAWLLTDGEDVKAYLYSISAERLAPLMGNASIRMSAFPHLYTDGIVLPKEGFDTNKYNSVPVLMVSGASEFGMFGAYDSYFSSEDMIALGEDTTKAALTYAKRYGDEMYRIFNTQYSAETMFDRYDSDIYLCQINYGSIYSDVTLPLGAFHGIFVPLLTDEHTFGLYGDYTTAGYQAMIKPFNNYLSNFLATGNPNSDGLAKWEKWTPDNKMSIVFDANDTTANIEMKNVSSSFEDVIAEMEADTTISEEVKLGIIRNVLNGRWFSGALDEYFENPSLWH